MPSPLSRSDGDDIRFSWLVQPIRDLTKNWDIDVASLLGEYLSELDKISISFDGGTTSMNFAEAALLIQGSACVYSKKVEYLYALVYQTLDLITKNKRNQQPASVDEGGKDNDVSLGRTGKETFLELDDIQEAKNIDLKEDEEDLRASQNPYLIPRTPLALIPTGEMNKKGEDLLLSHTGEVIGSRKDFKMNVCTVHHSGALLLDTSCICILEKSLQLLCSSTPAGPGLVAPASHVIEQAAQQHPRNDDIDDMIVDDGFGGDGFDYDSLSPVPPGTEDNQKTPPRPELRDRDGMRKRNIQNDARYEDPWKCLNPYDDAKFVNKPFKKGKPYKIPNSVFQMPMVNDRKRKRSKSKLPRPQNVKLEPLTSFLAQSSFLDIGALPSNPLKKPSYSEFNYLFWEEYLKRQELQRRERKYLVDKMSEEVYQDINAVVEEGADGNHFQGFAEGEQHNNDGNENDDSDGSVHGDFDFGMGDDDHGRELVGQTNNNNWDDCVVSSYEDLVRKYVNNCLLAAQQYAQETEISRRVKNWEQKILPVLKEEETHRPYDIHVYGKEILDNFKEEQMTFKDLIVGKKPFEVCRYFLSTLLMANMRNVEIMDTTDGLELDMMKLKLLDRTPSHERINEYLAPSLQNKQ